MIHMDENAFNRAVMHHSLIAANSHKGDAEFIYERTYTFLVPLKDISFAQSVSKGIRKKMQARIDRGRRNSGACRTTPGLIANTHRLRRKQRASQSDTTYLSGIVVLEDPSDLWWMNIPAEPLPRMVSKIDGVSTASHGTYISIEKIFELKDSLGSKGLGHQAHLRSYQDFLDECWNHISNPVIRIDRPSRYSVLTRISAVPEIVFPAQS